MLVRKNQSKFQNTAFLLVEIQIVIEFYGLTFPEKDVLIFGTSLSRLNSISSAKNFRSLTLLCITENKKWQK